MEWLKKSSAFLLLNSIALFIFLGLLLGIYMQLRMLNAYNPYAYWIGSNEFRAAGHWAVRFLVFSLAMSPIYMIFGWRTGLGLRKSAGLWSFVFAALHFSLFFADRFWWKVIIDPYIPLGIAAISILALMAITSNQFAMRLLKKWWKRLHRLVYMAGLLVALHTIIALGQWQKFPDWEARYLEMQIYGILMIVLLALRIRWLRELFRIPKAKTKPEFERPLVET